MVKFTNEVDHEGVVTVLKEKEREGKRRRRRRRSKRKGG